MTRVTLIPGDWVGPEVSAAVQEILASAGVEIEWEEHVVGQGALDPALLESCRRTRAVLKHRVDATRQPGLLPPALQLRKALGLWAQVRPIQALPGAGARFPAIDLVVVREVSEGVYSGLEHEVSEGVYEAVKVTTRAACERIARFAFDLAAKLGRRKVTIAHKSNIMKKSDGLFLRTAQAVAAEYAPGIACEEAIVDALCMRLVRDPGRFDVLLADNLFGDIVGDLCSGLGGGIGASPSACYGSDGTALFESPHGKAPALVGTGRANPIPLLRAALMLLEHVGLGPAAARIDAALREACRAGLVTADRGGNAGCREVRDAIVAQFSAS